MKAREIAEIVADRMEVSVEQLLGECALNRSRKARAIFQYILRQRQWSWQEIGRYTQRNRSTALHNFRRVDKSVELKSVAEEIVEQFASK